MKIEVQENNAFIIDLEADRCPKIEQNMLNYYDLYPKIPTDQNEHVVLEKLIQPRSEKLANGILLEENERVSASDAEGYSCSEITDGSKSALQVSSTLPK